MINQYTTPLSTKGNVKKFMFRQKKNLLFLSIKKYFHHDFPQMNLKKNTKTMISN